ncbi:hypothetical protein RchiOBHm_Chr2g0097431 [Rosa chinensis]|uniref:Uncharacterized protein n=1 Tax=Rosa chinensis TaxID=74649 RepID=A0A2P6RLB2_ROSCH|nr:hypothetical protein RchiOBHm_Chr2g0097431 [Rosa chinensis]
MGSLSFTLVTPLFFFCPLVVLNFDLGWKCTNVIIIPFKAKLKLPFILVGFGLSWKCVKLVVSFLL